MEKRLLVALELLCHLAKQIQFIRFDESKTVNVHFFNSKERVTINGYMNVTNITTCCTVNIFFPVLP